MDTIKITIKEGTKAAKVLDSYMKKKAEIREAVKAGKPVPYSKHRLVKF